MAQRTGRESFADAVNAVGFLLSAVKAEPRSIVQAGLWGISGFTRRMESTGAVGSP